MDSTPSSQRSPSPSGSVLSLERPETFWRGAWAQYSPPVCQVYRVSLGERAQGGLSGSSSPYMLIYRHIGGLVNKSRSSLIKGMSTIRAIAYDHGGCREYSAGDARGRNGEPRAWRAFLLYDRR